MRLSALLRAALAALAFALVPAFAQADEPASERATSGRTSGSAVLDDARSERLALFAGAGYLGSPGATGGAFCAGLRLRPGEHAAGSFDLGYGLLGAYQSTQDRWWAIPAIAFVVTASPVRFDVGVGAGVGTSSGYASWSAYTAAPFTPSWHATVPAVRAHAVAAFRLTRSSDAFVRADVASLWLAGSGSTLSAAEDSLWVALWVGAAVEAPLTT